MKKYSEYELDCKGPMSFSYEELKEIGGYWIYLRTDYNYDPTGHDYDGIAWGGWRWIQA